MASEKTLAVRSEKEKLKAERRAKQAAFDKARAEAEDRKERGQVAAQFITGLARDIYAQNVALVTAETPEALLAIYTEVAHKAMDAAIAFVRASNAYDDRSRLVTKDGPPIVPEPTDANGSPVDAQ